VKTHRVIRSGIDGTNLVVDYHCLLVSADVLANPTMDLHNVVSLVLHSLCQVVGYIIYHILPMLQWWSGHQIDQLLNFITKFA